jgi:hypothetical protein
VPGEATAGFWPGLGVSPLVRRWHPTLLIATINATVNK